MNFLGPVVRNGCNKSDILFIAVIIRIISVFHFLCINQSHNRDVGSGHNQQGVEEAVSGSEGIVCFTTIEISSVTIIATGASRIVAT